jgi:hypothetical protein
MKVPRNDPRGVHGDAIVLALLLNQMHGPSQRSAGTPDGRSVHPRTFPTAGVHKLSILRAGCMRRPRTPRIPHSG